MVTLRRLDAFAKTRPDLRQQSPVGGFITLFAAFIAGLLFIGQIALYISGTTSHSLILSRSTTVPLSLLEHQGRNKNKLPSHRGLISLKIHVTFPHIHCRNLDIVHDGASLSSGELYKIHGKTSLRLTKPTKKELQTTLGYQPTQHYDGCTIKGELRPPIVAGILSIGLSRQAWASASTALSTGFGNTVSESVQENLKQFNASHYIHAIEFGRTFSKQREKPLHKVRHVIENDFHGIAVSSLQVKLVPTVQYGFFGSEYSYQVRFLFFPYQSADGYSFCCFSRHRHPWWTLSYNHKRW